MPLEKSKLRVNTHKINFNCEILKFNLHNQYIRMFICYIITKVNIKNRTIHLQVGHKLT